MDFYKAVSPNMINRGFLLKEGLNVEDCKLEKGECDGSGLYFTNKEHILYWAMSLYPNGCLIFKVEIPQDATVIRGSRKWKSNMMVLSNGVSRAEFFKEYDSYEIVKYQNGLQLLREIGREENADLYKKAVMGHWMSLGDVPNQTEELCFSAVTSCGHALELVKEQTPEICMEAVRSTGLALMYVLPHLMTEKLCFEAVAENGLVLGHVPPHFITEDLCFRALSQTGLALRHVPPHLMSEEMCEEAVGLTGMALEYVPPHLLTVSMCMAAIRSDPYALKHVPENLMGPGLCMMAVSRNGMTLDIVPEHMRTVDICMKAVRVNGLALQFVKEQTPEICLAAVERTPEASRYVKCVAAEA